MIFNSFSFWLVYPIIFVIYWTIPAKSVKLKKFFLLIASYLLYSCWNPIFVLVLLAITIVTYSGGLALGENSTFECNGSDPNSKLRRKSCIFFTILGLFPLLTFKYYNFLKDSLDVCLVGGQLNLPEFDWAVPMGISFFSFQAVGYVLDVYYKRAQAERNFFTFALFVSYFPQVASGPISTAKELIPQLREAHPFCYEKGVEGLRLLLWGMFLKCVVADRLGIYVDTVFANYIHYSGMNCFMASLFYTLQIYADFAGYSCMAIGIAKTLGIDLINNFNRPYFATSITEFWKRWHISLTRWLTTHVYINLGGNRCSVLRQYLNIMVTFIVSGLWHGANWTFVFWGIIHGLLQIVEKALGIAPKGIHFERLEKYKLLKPFRIVLTFLTVSFAWIFFRMSTISDAFHFCSRILCDTTSQRVLYSMHNRDIVFSALSILILIFVETRKEFFSNKAKARWLDSKVCCWLFYIITFCLIISIGVLDAGSFIYVSF